MCNMNRAATEMLNGISGARPFEIKFIENVMLTK